MGFWGGDVSIANIKPLGAAGEGEMNFDTVARRLFLCLLTLILSLATYATAQMPAVEETSQSGGTESSSKPTASADDWHVGVTPYIWFAGLHGTGCRTLDPEFCHLLVGQIRSVGAGAWW
jgi:hypothetical protein